MLLVPIFYSSFSAKPSTIADPQIIVSDFFSFREVLETKIKEVFMHYKFIY